MNVDNSFNPMAVTTSQVAKPAVTTGDANPDSVRVSNANAPENSVESKTNNPSAEAVNLSKDSVSNVLDKMNQQLGLSKSQLRFQLDEDSNTMVINIVDQETGETIRKIPTDEALKASQRITEYLERVMSNSGADSNNATGMILESEA